MALVNAVRSGKTVADPAGVYDSARPLWEKSRAVIGGERLVKDYDAILDVYLFRNLLLPFSPSMTQQQYDFYKSEAELPGITAQYARVLIGGLLRKEPTLGFKVDVPEEASDWILNLFTQDNSPMISFLDDSLWEEIQTSRCWVHVDYPSVDNAGDLTTEERQAIKPYPIIWSAESVINWRLAPKADGTQAFDRIIVRNYEEEFKESEFHPSYIDTVWVHELVEGKYQVRKFQQQNEVSVVVASNGQIIQKYGTTVSDGTGSSAGQFVLVETITNIMMNGERLTEIPAWPLNGSAKIVDPILTPIIDREVALYNKISRRNHLLYGAATYTPYIMTNMSDDQFTDVVSAGLGSWLKLAVGDEIGVLDTPTAALQDMDRSIKDTLEEIAKLGVRMLTPETDQSGIALQIRNAAQTSQLGTLNAKISNTMSAVIAFMVNWRYDLKLKASDVEFKLSADFSPIPIGADFIRLMTEFYEKGLLPRSEWLTSLKTNDLVSPDYDDELGKSEIMKDPMVMSPAETMDYQVQIAAAGAAPTSDK